MRLTINLTAPQYERLPRWLAIKPEITQRGDGTCMATVHAKLRWWWKLALYGRALRSAHIRFAK